MVRQLFRLIAKKIYNLLETAPSVEFLAREVLGNALTRIENSQGDDLLILDSDFDQTFQGYAKLSHDANATKRNRKIVGLFLVQRKYITGQFGMGWSVNGFHIMAEAISWARQSFYERHRDICNVLFGALAGGVGSLVVGMYQKNVLTLESSQLEKIERELKAQSETGLANVRGEVSQLQNATNDSREKIQNESNLNLKQSSQLADLYEKNVKISGELTRLKRGHNVNKR